MALFVVSFTGITSGTALKTMCQIATPAGTSAELIEWSVSTNGTNASALPLKVMLGRQTSAGTGGVSFTPLAWDASGSTAVVTALTGPTAATWTAEPTAPATYLYNDYFTPVGIGVFVQYPLGRGIAMAVSTRLAIVVDATSGAAVNISGHMLYNE